MSRNGKHRRWTPWTSCGLCWYAMQPGVEVSDFCRREGVYLVLFYKWKRSNSWGRPVASSRSEAQSRVPRTIRHEAALCAAQECICRDHRRESRPKKRALGLEDHGQSPPELQNACTKRSS